MSPMPRGAGRCCFIERVSGSGPFAGRFLAGQHETGSVCTRKAGNDDSKVLAPSILRIGDIFHAIVEFVDSYRADP